MPSEQTTPSRAELIAKWEKRATELRKYPPTSVYQGAVIVVEKPSEARAIADALRDAERLDALEKVAREPGGILLHDEQNVGRRGLGLLGWSSSPRTLRQAVDSFMAPIDAATSQTEGRNHE